jgi:hypothetical protein
MTGIMNPARIHDHLILCLAGALGAIAIAPASVFLVGNNNPAPLGGDFVPFFPFE